MENNTIKIEAVLLTGKDAKRIPCLAVIGAASIIGGIGYGVYKIGKKVYKKFPEFVEFIKKES